MISWVEELNKNAIKLVFVRTFMALIILGGIVAYNKHKIKIPKGQIRILALSGCLMATYWVLLVVATNLANASVVLVGIATSPIWVTFILPFFNGGRPDFYQLMTGLNAIFGIYMIASNDFEYEAGMIVAILAALVGALLTVVNARFVKSHHQTVVTFYQMIGAFGLVTIGMPIYSIVTKTSMDVFNAPPTDYIIAFTMAYLFSVLAYSMLIGVMKKISAFTVALSTNLSPIYGVVIALLLSKKDEAMNIYFYSGAIIIVASVIAFPVLQIIFKNALSEKKLEKQAKVQRDMEILRQTIEDEENEKN